jgi:hypothetical protein
MEYNNCHSSIQHNLLLNRDAAEIDDFVPSTLDLSLTTSKKSACRASAASFVIAAHDKYASFLADLRALPANFLRSRLKIDFLRDHLI